MVVVGEEALALHGASASSPTTTIVLDGDHLSDQELIQTYKDQYSVERGFSFLKDPLFLASSVFVKKRSALWRSVW